MGTKSETINKTTTSIPGFPTKTIYTIPTNIQFVMNSDGELATTFENDVEDSDKEQFLLYLFDNLIRPLNTNASQVWMVRG